MLSVPLTLQRAGRRLAPRLRHRATGAPSAPCYRRASGAPSLVLDQFRPALTVEVCERPAVGAASPISLGSTWPSRPVFGVSSRMYPPAERGGSASTRGATGALSP